MKRGGRELKGKCKPVKKCILKDVFLINICMDVFKKMLLYVQLRILAPNTVSPLPPPPPHTPRYPLFRKNVCPLSTKFTSIYVFTANYFYMHSSIAEAV